MKIKGLRKEMNKKTRCNYFIRIFSQLQRQRDSYLKLESNKSIQSASCSKLKITKNRAVRKKIQIFALLVIAVVKGKDY